MKIRIDVDITPEEMRTFLGLPEVKGLQDEIVEDIRRKMREGVTGFDPLTVMKPFLPANLQSVEAMQRAFWQAFGASKEPDEPKDPPAPGA